MVLTLKMNNEYEIGNGTTKGMLMWLNYVVALFCLTQTYQNKHSETKITQVTLGQAEICASSGDGIV